MDKRLPVGIGLVVAGTVAALLGADPMMDVGTCASGGPYVVAQECPSDYDWLFWVMFAGLVAAVVGMILVFIASTQAVGFALVGLWFIVLGTAAFAEARSLEGDARLGLDIVGWVFAPLGAGSLLMAVLMHRAVTRGFGPSRVERR